MGGLKDGRSGLWSMRGVGSVLLLTLLVLALAQPMAPAPTLDEAQGPFSSTSSLALAFSGPSEGESVTGLLSVTVTATGTGTLSWVRIDVSDGSGWSEVGNRSSSPWFAQLDTTTLTNGSYQLRAVGLDADVDDEVTGFSPNFTVANQVPVITAFTVLNPGAGNGTSSNDRWWFATPANGTLQFRWGASDDDLERATLSNVPGTGNPSSDGPGTLAYGWDWTPGDLTEGTWNPRLNVLDGSGLTASLTRFIGIDRTGPDIGAITVGSSGGWQMDEDITLNGIKSTADDGFGSGVASTEYSLDGQSWQSTTADSLEVFWPNGARTVRHALQGDSAYRFVQAEEEVSIVFGEAVGDSIALMLSLPPKWTGVQWNGETTNETSKVVAVGDPVSGQALWFGGLYAVDFEVDWSALSGPSSGCTVSIADNYDPQAETDDGSCTYHGLCGEGTEWSALQQQCIPSGSVCPEDLDGDDLVGVSDVLLILSMYGESCAAETE